MATKSIAIGAYLNNEGAELIAVPEDREEIIAKVKEVMDANQPGSILSEDDLAILRAYLPAIGAAESTVNPTGGLNGKGKETVTVEGGGITVEATGTLDVTSVWEDFHDRKQWTGDMKIRKTDGTAPTMRIDFNFRFFGIGLDADGNHVVLHNKVQGRPFSDAVHTADFDAGNVAETCRIDISTFVQDGFFLAAECNIRTTAGLLTI
ncbi:MAG: hypothetical protein Q4D06_07505 [Coriobacteriia bacterium]|nr:hypothetical protein [Coriobacteriia bacterium]